MKNTIGKSSVQAAALLFLLAGPAKAFQIPDPKNPYIPVNKMVDCWTGHGPCDGAMDSAAPYKPFTDDQIQNFDFELAARWNFKQTYPALKSYQYLLKNGFNTNNSFLNTFLGKSAIIFGYHYDVKPAHRAGLFTRTDKYVTSPALDFRHTFVQMGSSKIRSDFAPSYDVEFQFERQFKDAQTAFLSEPYFVKNLPVTADNALNGMKKGDLFIFKANLDIATGPEYVARNMQLKPGVAVGPVITLSGAFQTHILRMEGSKIRMKIVTYRRNGLGLDGRVGLMDPPQITQLSFVGDKIVRVVLGNLNLASASAGLQQNKSFVVDYVLDLSIPEVKEAFEKSMAQLREFDYANAGNPLKNDDTYLKTAPLTSLVELENLAHQNKLVSARNDFTVVNWGRRFDLTLGNKMIGRVNLGMSTSTNETESEGQNGLKDTSIFKVGKDHSSISFFYSIFDFQYDKTAASLQQSQQVEPGFLIQTERSQSHFSAADLIETQAELKRNSPDLASQVDFSEWQNAAANAQHSVTVRTQTIIPISSMNQTPQLSSAQVASALESYLSNLPLKDYYDRTARNQRNFGTGMTGEERITKTKARISSIVSKVLNPAMATPDRLNTLQQLSDDSLFGTIGAGFMMSLIPPAAQKQGFTLFDMSEAGNAVQPILKYLGDRKLSQDYARFLAIDNLTNDEEINIRLESEDLAD